MDHESEINIYTIPYHSTLYALYYDHTMCFTLYVLSYNHHMYMYMTQVEIHPDDPGRDPS